MDEVDVPYRAFLEQFKGDIIKRIMHDKKWTLTKAKNFLSEKFNYDPYIYSIMEDLVKEGKYIILNRNPTITFGSILMMKIRKVKKDHNDLTLSIPSTVLPGLVPIKKA